MFVIISEAVFIPEMLENILGQFYTEKEKGVLTQSFNSVTWFKSLAFLC